MRATQAPFNYDSMRVVHINRLVEETARDDDEYARLLGNPGAPEAPERKSESGEWFSPGKALVLLLIDLV